MKSSPFDFIDSVIEPIPVVGRLWADAFYTLLGLSDAFNLRHFGVDGGPAPAAQNVVDFAPRIDANLQQPLRDAA